MTKRNYKREEIKYHRPTNRLVKPRTKAKAKNSAKTREYYSRKWGL
tara:strand:- start:736 stop:873 length:138 start_codon:yes stop_codon:yes gene_type:complete